MFARGLQGHQIHHVDHADLQVRQILSQEVDCGEGLKRRNISAARHHHVRFAALIAAGPLPDAHAGGAVGDGRVHIQPLRRGLLADHDDIHIAAAAQAMIRHR